MTAKELIDEFVQGKIAANHLRDYADMENIPIPTILNLLRQEVKEAEAEQTRLMELLVKIQRDPRTVMRIEYIQAIKQIVNGN